MIYYLTITDPCFLAFYTTIAFKSHQLSHRECFLFLVSLIFFSYLITRCRSRFCPPGHNPLAEIVPHGHNPLADIVPLQHILSTPPPPPPSPTDAWPSRFLFVGVRSYKPRPLFASSQKGKFSTHTLPLPLPPFTPAVLSIYIFPPDVLLAIISFQ